MKKKYWIILSIFFSLVGLGVLAYFFILPNFKSIERWVMTVPPGSQTSDEKQTLASLTVINDHPFYQMTFYGDYLRYLEMKKRFYWAMGFPKPECSSFAALNPQGHAILGYNNDGNYIPLILLFTHPSDGYVSISISPIGDGFPWFTRSFTPFDSDRNRSLLLYSPYSTQSGMNEMGLAISTMTDPSGEWELDPDKDTLGAAEARRYILDHAKNVEEAITLLSQVNVSYKGTSVSHLLLADQAGHSALIEWVDGKMVVMSNQQPWQVSTNFRVYGATDSIDDYLLQYQSKGIVAGDNLGRNHWRYAAAWETLREANGLLSSDQSMDLLRLISQPYKTQYSIVFDLTTGDVQIVTERKYDTVYHYQLSFK
jgi:Linear amide C-N hydrolases, choloylglycine hydrolase family